MTGPSWRRYLRFWGSDPDADTEDEIRFHIESHVQDLIATGMTFEDAQVEAMRRFGDPERTRQRCHDIDREFEQDRRRADMWEALKQDLRYAARTLRRNPGFTVVAALTLALGIGANTAIFSVINGVLLRPLPYEEPERLVRLFTAFRGSGTLRYAMSQPEFMDYKGLTTVFENAAAFTGTGLTLTGVGEPERVRGIAATRDFFPVLGITPVLGRNFEGDEGRSGVEPVVILSHEYWQSRFGADPDLVGRVLELNGIRRRVVGILPPGVAFNRAQAFIPYYINPDSLTGRSSNFLSGVARLRPGITLEQAQRALDALTRRLTAEYPRAYPASMGFGATVISLHEELVGEVRWALYVLMGAVGLVLLIACVNVANLLLARGEGRQREMAVRLALGAGRGRIVRQLLTESTLLAMLGATVGVAIAWWGMKALLAVNPTAIPRMEEIRLDLVVGIVTLVVAVLTGVLFGLAPALQLARTDLQSNLKEATRGGSESGQRQRLGRALVTVEIGLAVVVVIGAALLMRSFWTMRNADPGFRPSNLLVVDLSLPGVRYDAVGTVSFYQRLLQRLQALPGVERVAAASEIPPVAGGNNRDIAIEGRPLIPGQAAPSPNVRTVTGEYVRALGMTMVAGRALGAQDHAGSMPVAVINEATARLAWPGEDPVGQRVRFARNAPWVTIVGVVRDMRSAGLAAPPPAELFLLHEQMPAIMGNADRTMYVILRTVGDPVALMAPSRAAVAELDPQLAITGVRTMAQVMDLSVAQPRFTMLLLGVFGAVALALAAIGIYGVMAFAVRRRTREIGIRMALGGAPRDVVWMVVGQGMRLALLGLAVGLMAALYATRAMRSLLYGVRNADPVTFLAITLLLALVAFVACWFPARRAVRTDPTAALRAD